MSIFSPTMNRDSIRSKVLGREGVWGRETFLQKGFPPPHFFFFFSYCFTGTVEIALKGEPSTRRRLTAR